MEIESFTSMLYMNELNSQANKLKKLIQSEDTEKAKNQTALLLKTLNSGIESQKAKNSINKHFINPLINSLNVIKDFVKTKFFEKIRLSVEFSTFPEKIREILQQLPLLSADDEFYRNVWQKSVKIISFLLDSGNVHYWHKCVQMLFLSSPVGKDILKTPDVLALRFRFLINYLIKRSSQIASLWWEIISSSIFSLFIPYPVLSLNGNIESKNCVNGKCPKSVFEDVVRLFKNSIGKYNNVLKKDSPNEAIALIYILIQDEDVNGFYSLLEWFISLWFPLANQDFKKYETFSLLNIFATMSHSIIVSFMQLFARFIVKKIINDKDSSIYPLFLTFRGIWKGPLSVFCTPSLLQNVLFSIYAELTAYSSSFAILTYLTFTFDYKLISPIIWDFFNTRAVFNSKNVDVCSMFISIISISFSPMFLIFSKEKVNEYFVGIKNRQQRNNEDNVIDVKSNMKLFNDPYGFFEFLPNDRFIEIKESYNEMIKENLVCMLEVSNDGWEYDTAMLYISSFLTSFPKNIQFRIYSDMLNAFNAIQDILPIALVNNKTFLWDKFITPLFDYLLYSKKLSFDILTTVNNAISNMEFNIIDEKNNSDWIKIIIKYLSAKKQIDVKSLLYPVLKSLLLFSPESNILVPFLAVFINQNSIETTSIFNHNFIVSAYSICFSNDNITIPSDFNDTVSKWKGIDHKYIEKALFLCDMKNRSDLLAYIQESIIKTSNGDISFYFICSLLVQELFLSDHVSEWMQSSFLASTKNIIDSRPEYTQIFAFLSDLSSNIIQKFPTFLQYFVNESLSRYHDPLFLRSVFELVLPSPNLVTLFLAKLKTMNIKNFMSFFEPIPFNLYKRFIPPASSPEDIDIHLTFDSKYINSIHFCDDDSFDFYNKSLYSYQSFHVEQIKTKEDKENNIELPEVNESVIENINDDQYDSLLSSILNNLFKPSQKEIEITTTHKPLPEDVQDDLPMINDFEYSYNAEENIFYYQSYKCLSAINFFTTFYNISSMNISCFKQSQLFRIKLTSLYRASFREETKIGVIYVAPNQFDQKSILSNTEETCSENFKNFLASLGSFVDLSQHKGYNGKLDNVTGKSVYYCNSQMEVMFHVSTLLPDNPKDPQKIDKKRHIGNDHVHIVWCENHNGYDTSVITSQFNDAHIIIFPYKKGLYRVIVQKKNQSLNFFPLPNDSILDGKSLGFLVRATAVIADKIITQSQDLKPHELYSKLFDILVHET